MSMGHLHPADEKALAQIFAAIREKFAGLPPGRRITAIIERGQNGRVSPESRVDRPSYPLQDPT